MKLEMSSVFVTNFNILIEKIKSKRVTIWLLNKIFPTPRAIKIQIDMAHTHNSHVCADMSS